MFCTARSALLAQFFYAEIHRFTFVTVQLPRFDVQYVSKKKYKNSLNKSEIKIFKILLSF